MNWFWISPSFLFSYVTVILASVWLVSVSMNMSTAHELSNPSVEAFGNWAQNYGPVTVGPYWDVEDSLLRESVDEVNFH